MYTHKGIAYWKKGKNHLLQCIFTDIIKFICIVCEKKCNAKEFPFSTHAFKNYCVQLAQQLKYIMLQIFYYDIVVNRLKYCCRLQKKS